MPDVREDILTGDLVIVAPGRATRPDTFRVTTQPLPPAAEHCPFCPGNEHETPPEVFRTGGGAPDTPGWRVRVVPNLYPIVAGAHEVVILSPAHDTSLGRLDDEPVRELFRVLRDRVAFHRERGLAHVQVFVNHGRAAGASIEHPHAQLIGLDLVPPRAAALRDRVRDAVHEVAGSGLLLHDEHVVAWCPPASLAPLAIRWALPGGATRFEHTGDDDLGAVAIAVRDGVRTFQTVVGDAPYNLLVQTATHDWWIDLLPRLTVQAGFELGTGVWVNPMRSDDAAAALRDAL